MAKKKKKVGKEKVTYGQNGNKTRDRWWKDSQRIRGTGALNQVFPGTKLSNPRQRVPVCLIPFQELESHFDADDALCKNKSLHYHHDLDFFKSTVIGGLGAAFETVHGYII